ncbi:PASTA domain-containing protein [Microtetraspora sp. NBRC 13810]|uniref:PASTA domain-containing protein n=1 Tax=Microtetraspora sp. NBRC 13810 TaxID=3030990 RepID=UPI0025548D7B|nr:PASTA domain-containing protein [Microtetraspora sp. NBRC 13810]
MWGWPPVAYLPPPPPVPPEEPPARGGLSTLGISLIIIYVLVGGCSVASALGIVFTGGIRFAEPVAPAVSDSPPDRSLVPLPEDGTGEGAPSAPAPTPPQGSNPAQPPAQGPAVGGLPNVVGLDGVAARLLLGTAGYTSVTLQSSDGQPVTLENAWTVVAQSPQAGTTVNQADPIVLTVSPTTSPPAGQPTTGQPAQGQPAQGQPTTGQSTTGQPTTGQPTTPAPGGP